MARLFVRIAKGKNTTSFFRAGISFTREWQAIEVDDATASRLYAEQMLEVTDTEPNPEPILVEANQTAPVQTENNGADVDLTETGLDQAESTESTAKKKGKS